MEDRTRRSRDEWDQEAAAYDRSAWLDPYLIGDSRARLCGQTSGRTLEVAIGTGLNLGFYPPDVPLIGVDFSAGMLTVAAQRAVAEQARVSLVQADAQRLPFGDATFDTVVSTLAMCAVPDQAAVIAEMHRVLVPGGRLLLVDHIEYARIPMKWVEPLRTHRHLVRRRPLDLVRRQGFEIDRLDRLTLGFVDRIVAHRPN
ncbi:MAG TPA: class I SAM-dependent methyltransferase [Jiangellaceae bacterium]